MCHCLVSTDPTKKKKFSVKRLLELSQHRINPNCPVPDIYGNKLRLYTRLGISVTTKDGHLNSKKMMKETSWKLSDEDLPCIEADSFYEDSNNLNFEEKEDGASITSSRIEQFEAKLDLAVEQLDNSQELPEIQKEVQNFDYNDSL